MTVLGNGLRSSRWRFVAFAAAVIGVAGTYQFLWSSVSDAVGERVAITGVSLGTVCTLFIIAQTLSQFPAGRLRDRFGPRPPTAAAGVLLALGYVGTAYAASPATLYVAYTIGGVAYTVAINTPVKWFTQRRGLATGVVGMAYSGVSVVLIPAVRGRVDDAFVSTLLVFGGGAAVVCVASALVDRDLRAAP